MKYLVIILTFLIQYLPTKGQELEITTNKESYKFDELVEVVFKISAHPDSSIISQFDGFRQISGPNNSSTTSIINGIKTESKTITYTLRAIKSGNLTINSPTYFVNGKKITGQQVTINIQNSDLTEEELKEKRNKEFIEDGIKPTGTLRVVYNNEIGYLEVFDGIFWQFNRRLKVKELRKIRKNTKTE